jgi:hypothetical protein
MNPRDNYALRKAQLVAQCDLERLRMRFALGHIRNTVTAPVQTPVPTTTWARPVAAMLLGFALPSLGAQRVKGIVGILSMALTGYRAVHNWRALQHAAVAQGVAADTPGNTG